MKTSTALVASALVLGAIGGLAPAAHAGDPEAGRAISGSCAACHGADGNSELPTFPRLAGQWADYLEYALQSYKNGNRKNAIMSGLAAPLSDEDIANLAAFYASQPAQIYTAD